MIQMYRFLNQNLGYISMNQWAVHFDSFGFRIIHFSIDQFIDRKTMEKAKNRREKSTMNQIKIT